MGGVPAELRMAASLGGEMGSRILSYDWPAHPLGDPAEWSAGVRTTVATALACRFPTVLWLGDQLRLIYNDGYIPMLGDKHPAALGSAGADVWWDIWDVVGPLLDGVVATGQATWSDDLKLMLVNDGRRRERYFTFSYSPLIAAGGSIEGVFCAVAETTERVLSERRLRTLSTLAAALMDAQTVDTALDTVVEVCAHHPVDLPFAAVYAGGEPDSRARLRSATPGADAVLPRLLAPFANRGAVADDGLRLVPELPVLLPSLAARLGDDCPEQAVVVTLSGTADAVTGGPSSAALVLGLNRYRPLDDQYRGFCRLVADQVSATMANVTAYQGERRRAESLAELDHAKTTFLTNVSHEFRTPLTLMLGPLDDALESLSGGDDALADRLRIVQRNGRRLLRLVNALLDFSRIEAGQSKPQLAVVDLGALTAGIASSFAEVCRMADIELVLDCRTAWAGADAAMWETIVLNLVSNAFKYTLAGSITVTAAPGIEGGATMTVSDTGTGIAAEHLPRLFDRFYRPEDTGGRTAEGSGIGLALVRSLVEMHHGGIEVDSAPGRGTTVRVSLPATDAVPSASVADSIARAGQGNDYADEALGWLGASADADRVLSSRQLVLVADDNADMRQHLATVLGSRWDVIEAGDGRQALELVRRNRPDLLITDVMMPELDGFGLIEAIRAEAGLASLPVIMLSARAGQEAVGGGLAAGADHYLVKPFTSADLISHVAARLEAAARDRTRPPREEAAERDQAVASLTADMEAATSVSQALDALLRTPDCSLRATAGAVGLLDEAGSHLRITYAGDLPRDITDRYHLVSIGSPVMLAETARTDQRMVVPDTGAAEARFLAEAADKARAVRACILEPLHADDGTVLGTLGLGWPRPREMSPADSDMTRRVAAILARAVARISAAEREHQIALSLQERLLGLGVTSPAAAVSAAYQPAGEVMRVGGDWYTATPLGPARIGISAGDVVGHGLAAATVMSQLRSALGAASLATDDPAAVIDLLDRYAQTLDDAAFATVAYAIIDTTAGTVSYACAGHPYPLVVGPEGTVTWLRDGRRPPLAVRSFASSLDVPTGAAALPPGSLLVLYTDGLIERRSEPLDDGFARLTAAAAGCARLPAGQACRNLVSQMTSGQGYADDVAIIAVRPTGTTAASHVDAMPASFSELRPARDRLRGWLAHLGTSPATTHDVLLGAGEALSNAMEHGSELNPHRTVSIEAFASGDELSVTVTDAGRWQKDSAASRANQRGRGLRLIHGLAKQSRTARTILGTEVTMTFGLGQTTG
jgi:signal transduction histidine kinase/DNA-binding response OmpR family regulator/anti-sigma regulatory factor (Ser/Thr protein kinase)